MDVGACLVGEGVRGRTHMMSAIRLLSILQKGMHFNVKRAYNCKSDFISEAEFQRRKARQLAHSPGGEEAVKPTLLIHCTFHFACCCVAVYKNYEVLLDIAGFVFNA